MCHSALPVSTLSPECPQATDQEGHGDGADKLWRQLWGQSLEFTKYLLLGGLCGCSAIGVRRSSFKFQLYGFCFRVVINGVINNYKLY